MPDVKCIKIDEVEYIRKDTVVTYDREVGPWKIGKSYVIRTVTMIQHGKLLDVTPNELVITNASWIADTGRFSDFIHGKILPNEVEPFPKDEIVIIGRGALIDACQLDACFDKQI